MSPESAASPGAAEVVSRRRSSSGGAQPPPPPCPPPPRVPPPPVSGHDVRNARQVELDALRQKGLAKIFNRHFTTVTESIAREREAADMALKELEKRRDTEPRRAGASEGRAAPQAPSGDSTIIDRVYSELQRRKDEVKRKERETMELYRKYVSRYGGPGAAANFGGASTSQDAAAPTEPASAVSRRPSSNNPAVDADAARQADVLLARMRERSSSISGNSQEGTEDSGNTRSNVSSMARKWEDASAGPVAPSLQHISPGSRPRTKFSLPPTSRLTPPPVMASSDDGSNDNSDAQASGRGSRIKFANLDEVLETSFHPEDKDADSAASTPTRSSSKRVLSKSAFIERSMEDGDDTPTTSGDSVAAVDPEAILSQIPGGADGIDEESGILRAARRTGANGPEDDDDSVLSGISSIATRTVIMTEAEQRLAEFLRIETDNIRRLLEGSDEDQNGSPASGSRGNADVGSTVGGGSVSSGDTTRAAEDAARIAEEMARTMAETAAGWVDGTVASAALEDDDDAADAETWYAYWDTALKREYYFEPQSGEVTWDRPKDKKIDDSTLEKPREAELDLDDADRVEVKDFSAKKSVSLEESTVDPRNVTLEQAIEEFRPDSDVISYRSMISHSSGDSGNRKSSSLQEYRERRAKAALRRRKRKLRRLFAGAAVGVAGAVCVYHYRDRLWPGEDIDGLEKNTTDSEAVNVTHTFGEKVTNEATDSTVDKDDAVTTETGCTIPEGSGGCPPEKQEASSESFVAMTEEMVRKVVEDSSSVVASDNDEDSEIGLNYFDVSDAADDISQVSSLHDSSETGSLHTAVDNLDELVGDDGVEMPESRKSTGYFDADPSKSENDAVEKVLTETGHTRGYSENTMISSDTEKVEQVVNRLDESQSRDQLDNDATEAEKRSGSAVGGVSEATLNEVEAIPVDEASDVSSESKVDWERRDQRATTEEFSQEGQVADTRELIGGDNLNSQDVNVSEVQETKTDVDALLPAPEEAEMGKDYSTGDDQEPLTREALMDRHRKDESLTSEAGPSYEDHIQRQNEEMSGGLETDESEDDLGVFESDADGVADDLSEKADADDASETAVAGDASEKALAVRPQFKIVDDEGDGFHLPTDTGEEFPLTVDKPAEETGLSTLLDAESSAEGFINDGVDDHLEAIGEKGDVEDKASLEVPNASELGVLWKDDASSELTGPSEGVVALETVVSEAVVVDSVVDVLQTDDGLVEESPVSVDAPVTDAEAVVASEGNDAEMSWYENAADSHHVGSQEDLSMEGDASTIGAEEIVPLPTSLNDHKEQFVDARDDEPDSISEEDSMVEPSGVFFTPADELGNDEMDAAENVFSPQSKARSAFAFEGQSGDAVSLVGEVVDEPKLAGGIPGDGGATLMRKPLYCKIPLASLLSDKCRQRPAATMPPSESAVDVPTCDENSTGTEIAPFSSGSDNLPVLAKSSPGVCKIPFAYLFNKRCRQQPVFDAENVVKGMFE